MSMSFEIPNGLTDLLQDFTVAVLKERPTDLVKFAAEYFNKLSEKKNEELAEKGRGVRFAESEPMQTDESDDEPMPEPPPNRFTRRKSVSAERYDPEADDDEGDDKIVYPKTDEQRKRLGEAIKPIFIFRSLEPITGRVAGHGPQIRQSPQVADVRTEHIIMVTHIRGHFQMAEQMSCVLDAMFEKKFYVVVLSGNMIFSTESLEQLKSGLFSVSPGEHVIDQGDDGDNFYVIDSGTYDIYVDNKAVGKYENTGSFGELALMYNMPRAATIVATSEGSLWAMDRTTFRRIVLKNAFNKRKVYESLLENVPMLKTLDAYERMNIADALFSKTYEDGDVIIKQGDSADCMYFIEEGEVKITVKNLNDPDSDEMVVKNGQKGTYFGELALVTHKPRAATVYAIGKTKVAVLDVQAFERLLGPCMDIMKRNIDEYEEQLVAVFGSKADIGDLR